MKEKTLDIISYVMLSLVFIGILILGGCHTFDNSPVEPEKSYLQENEYPFFPEWVDSVEIVSNDTEYYANVYYMDTLVLFTSVEEAESLIKQMDNAYANYAEDTLELEEALGSITDNSLIKRVMDSLYILELDWIKK